MNNIKIVIGADVVPTASNMTLFEEADSVSLVGKELKEYLDSADFRICNLEVPLTNQISPIAKCGPHLAASKISVAGIKELGIDFVTLANNHIFDHGEKGLFSTIDALKQVGIAYAGVGNTREEASKPYIVIIRDKRIGVYCCAEHEFSIGTEKTAGANPFDPLESFDHIEELRKEVDYVIVLYHGGKEHYRYPSPYLQKVCRKIVDKGADLVICQHTHCIGCEEKWKDGTIVYGQGNFLFDYSESEFWQTSLLIEVVLEEKGSSISYVPLRKEGNGVRMVCKGESSVIEDFYFRSEQIKQKGFIENAYSEFAKFMLKDYFGRIAGYESFVFKALNRICKNKLREIKYKRLYNKQKSLLPIINCIECEAHQELLLKGMKELVK